jgi:YMGG-like Gly-zipper
MKQILFTLTTTVLFLTACNSEKKNNMDTEKRIVFTDTAALRLSNAATDKAASEELLAPEANQDNTKPKVVTVVKYVNAPQKRAARRSTSTRRQQAPSQQNNDQVYDAPSTGTAGTGTTSGSGNTGGEVATTPEVKKKKGWSDAAKGATIGGVGGAVAGAVISKNKGKGAVIGGVIGAAGGYILGRKADKKSGRANYTQR